MGGLRRSCGRSGALCGSLDGALCGSLDGGFYTVSDKIREAASKLSGEMARL
jgi:hypothetical protein